MGYFTLVDDLVPEADGYGVRLAGSIDLFHGPEDHGFDGAPGATHFAADLLSNEAVRHQLKDLLFPGGKPQYFLVYVHAIVFFVVYE